MLDLVERTCAYGIALGSPDLEAAQKKAGAPNSVHSLSASNAWFNLDMDPSPSFHPSYIPVKMWDIIRREWADFQGKTPIFLRTHSNLTAYSDAFVFENMLELVERTCA